MQREDPINFLRERQSQTEKAKSGPIPGTASAGAPEAGGPGHDATPALKENSTPGRAGPYNGSSKSKNRIKTLPVLKGSKVTAHILFYRKWLGGEPPNSKRKEDQGSQNQETSPAEWGGSPRGHQAPVRVEPWEAGWGAPLADPRRKKQGKGLESSLRLLHANRVLSVCCGVGISNLKTRFENTVCFCVQSPRHVAQSGGVLWSQGRRGASVCPAGSRHKNNPRRLSTSYYYPVRPGPSGPMCFSVLSC